ncbi:MAG: hypothetical protein H6R00_2471 [Proteobacteria bacterium]|nr:hypothetical protein [Pseudomonadota bacterium]
MNSQNNITSVDLDANKVSWSAVMDAINTLKQTTDEETNASALADRVSDHALWLRAANMEEPLHRVGAFLITFEAVVQRGPSHEISGEQCDALAYLAGDALRYFADLDERWDAVCDALKEREAAQ